MYNAEGFDLNDSCAAVIPTKKTHRRTVVLAETENILELNLEIRQVPGTGKEKRIEIRFYAPRDTLWLSP